MSSGTLAIQEALIDLIFKKIVSQILIICDFVFVKLDY